MNDPFDILGIEPRFDLDRAAIQRAYLRKAAEHHPDHAQPSSAQPSSAQPDPAAGDAASARLNAAKAVLDDPEQRAGALLARLGGPAKEHDRTLPDGFLLEMMEARERMESERNDPAAVACWEDWGESRRRAHMAEAARLFAQLLAGPQQQAAAGPGVPAPGPGAESGRRDVLRAIRRELNAWRYIERMLEQLAEDPGAAPHP